MDPSTKAPTTFAPTAGAASRAAQEQAEQLDLVQAEADKVPGLQKQLDEATKEVTTLKLTLSETKVAHGKQVALLNNKLATETLARSEAANQHLRDTHALSMQLAQAKEQQNHGAVPDTSGSADTAEQNPTTLQDEYEQLKSQLNTVKAEAGKGLQRQLDQAKAASAAIRRELAEVKQRLQDATNKAEAHPGQAEAGFQAQLTAQQQQKEYQSAQAVPVTELNADLAEAKAKAETAARDAQAELDRAKADAEAALQRERSGNAATMRPMEQELTTLRTQVRDLNLQLEAAPVDAVQAAAKLKALEESMKPILDDIVTTANPETCKTAKQFADEAFTPGVIAKLSALVPADNSRDDQLTKLTKSGKQYVTAMMKLKKTEAEADKVPDLTRQLQEAKTEAKNATAQLAAAEERAVQLTAQLAAAEQMATCPPGSDTNNTAQIAQLAPAKFEDLQLQLQLVVAVKCEGFLKQLRSLWNPLFRFAAVYTDGTNGISQLYNWWEDTRSLLATKTSQSMTVKDYNAYAGQLGWPELTPGAFDHCINLKTDIVSTKDVISCARQICDYVMNNVQCKKGRKNSGALQYSFPDFTMGTSNDRHASVDTITASRHGKQDISFTRNDLNKTSFKIWVPKAWFEAPGNLVLLTAALIAWHGFSLPTAVIAVWVFFQPDFGKKFFEPEQQQAERLAKLVQAYVAWDKSADDGDPHNGETWDNARFESEILQSEHLEDLHRFYTYLQQPDVTEDLIEDLAEDLAEGNAGQDGEEDSAEDNKYDQWHNAHGCALHRLQILQFQLLCQMFKKAEPENIEKHKEAVDVLKQTAQQFSQEFQEVCLNKPLVEVLFGVPNTDATLTTVFVAGMFHKQGIVPSSAGSTVRMLDVICDQTASFSIAGTKGLDDEQVDEACGNSMIKLLSELTLGDAQHAIQFLVQACGTENELVNQCIDYVNNHHVSNRR